jgi:choline dehydrogenase-like flavoprotein
VARPSDRTLAAIVDTFAPGGDGLPSASELGVHRAILAEVEALGRPSLVSQLDLLLRAVESPAANLLLRGRAVRFSALGQADREAYLRRLATSPIPLKRTAFQDLKRLTFLLLYGMESSPYRVRSGFVPTPPDPADVTPVHTRTPSPGETVEADVCVIGSGAGGGVVAASLAAAGRRVVVLERARYVDETGFGGPELEGLARLFLDRGLAATDDRWISIRAGSAVGGGTVVNWSSSLRLPAAVREEWAAVGIGGELDDAYDAVEREIHVGRDESDRNGPNGALERGLQALGLDATTIPRNVLGCGECGPCAVGCRRGAKRSSLRVHLADACRDGTEILDATEARRILVRSGRVDAVVASVPGGEITVRAPLVALAGGSILSPAVLLRSGIATSTAGRSLHLHPVSAVVGFYDEPLDPWEGVPQSVMSESFADLGGGYGFRIEAAPTHPGLIGSGYPWSNGAEHATALARAAHAGAFLAIVRDRGAGRVDLARDGGVRVRYGVGPDERRLLEQATIEVARVHRAAGASRIVTLHTPALELASGGPFEPFAAEISRRGISPNRILLFSAHQMSTCRIGTSPRDSVADPDGRVWGVKGLFVTDTSAFPTASGVNPMLTAMALARRTAERMPSA